MPRDPRLVLIACCLAMLSVGENSTAIMAALPAMTSSLRLGPATVEWAVNAYLLASAVFIILGGEAADQFGARRSSAAGIALFALASLIIAIAPAVVLSRAPDPFRPVARHVSLWRRTDPLRPAALGGDAPSPAAARLRSVFEPELCACLPAGVPPHVRHHDPPSLLQPLRAGAGRA